MMTSNKFLSDLEKAQQVAAGQAKELTDNGAVVLSSSGNAFCDVMFNLSNMRDKSFSIIKMESMWNKCMAVDLDLALRFLFYIRDVREGVGERDTFRRLMAITLKNIANQYSLETIAKLLYLSSQYGRWDDVWEIFPPMSARKVYDKAVAFIVANQLQDDLLNYSDGNSVSLLAKWLPSVNAGNYARVRSKYIRSLINVPEDKYRKALALLRKHLDVTEVKMSANQWDKIKYPAVPSKASLVYKDAFLRHDKDRYIKFIQDVKEGKSKINSAVNAPHEIVHKYVDGSGWFERVYNHNETLEQLWKSLPNYLGDKKMLVVCDTSGSMSSTIPKSKCTCHDVANALAIYASEHLTGAFKDKIILFSGHPEYIDLEGKETLRDKLAVLNAYNECSNTDIAATFRLILKTALRANLKPEDMPESVLIISDMQFDGLYSECFNIDKMLFEQLQDEFKAAGYTMPKIVFWNVECNETTTGVPMMDNESGVILLSGFSANLMKMALSCEMDPWCALKKELLSERYDIVSEILNSDENKNNNE